MNTLAIDIGGTKFTVAAFEDERIVQHESRKTDRESGRDWMLLAGRHQPVGSRFADI